MLVLGPVMVLCGMGGEVYFTFKTMVQYILVLGPVMVLWLMAVSTWQYKLTVNNRKTCFLECQTMPVIFVGRNIHKIEKNVIQV